MRISTLNVMSANTMRIVCYRNSIDATSPPVVDSITEKRDTTLSEPQFLSLFLLFSPREKALVAVVISKFYSLAVNRETFA